jgi:diguanylate cyclase (GGDEF)-like protein
MLESLNRLGLTPREHRVSVLPSTIAAILMLAIAVFDGTAAWPQGSTQSLALLGVGAAGILYLALFNLWVIPSPAFKPAYTWINSVLSAAGLCAITYLLPAGRDFHAGFLLLLAVITSSMVADWPATYVMIALATLGSFAIRGGLAQPREQWISQLSFALIGLIVVETIRQLRNLSRGHIRRLEAITEFGRNITSTLNSRQVMALLNAAFQNAVEADTYFVGLREGDEIRLELVYDDGEYFDNLRVKLDGSLSSWVLDNQESLFLPDLRREVELPGVRLVLVGQHKTSLSWMGVPMRSEHVDGIISIGSYRPNAFDRADLELLSTLAQNAAQVLENTHRHEQVELRSQMDSLTGLYNHGNFLRLLQAQADQASLAGQPLSLIMLDVDNFKQYNDSYGHLIGDEVLTTLSSTMREHVKATDAVGRWGGEEFAISLPNAGFAQAQQVAMRIRDTMLTLFLRSQDQSRIPVPTVSQGIAVFPEEAGDLVELIHLADKRLYIAKERGRNQIEPDPSKGQPVVKTTQP